MNTTQLRDGLWTAVQSLSLANKKWLSERLQADIAEEKRRRDPSLMTREEFFAQIDASLQEAREGKVYEMLPGENLDAFMDRVGAVSKVSDVQD